MKNLKDQLIRLGNTNKNLRPHIKPVLDSLKTSAKDPEFLYREKTDTIHLMLGRIEDVLQQNRKDLERGPKGPTYADVNGLGYVEDLLEQVIRFLGRG